MTTDPTSTTPQVNTSAETSGSPVAPLARIHKEPPSQNSKAVKYVILIIFVVFTMNVIGRSYGAIVAFESLGAWFVCGAIAAAIGKSKGSESGSLLLGVILGPIGIAIAIIGDGNRMPCPYCKERIVNTATVCMHCKKELNADWSVGS